MCMKTMKLNEDLSVLTCLPEKVLSKVYSKAICCIVTAVLENALVGEEVTEIVMDIGSLWIQYKDNQIKYKFTPNAKLDKELINALRTKESPLQEILEESTIRKFKDLYRDLC